MQRKARCIDFSRCGAALFPATAKRCDMIGNSGAATGE